MRRIRNYYNHVVPIYVHIRRHFYGLDHLDVHIAQPINTLEFLAVLSVYLRG